MRYSKGMITNGSDAKAISAHSRAMVRRVNLGKAIRAYPQTRQGIAG